MNNYLEIKLINIQGLTQVKLLDLINIMNPYTILCITETHQKYEHLQIPTEIKCIYSHRKMDDKKGGGLLIMYKNNQNLIF